MLKWVLTQYKGLINKINEAANNQSNAHAEIGMEMATEIIRKHIIADIVYVNKGQ